MNMLPFYLISATFYTVYKVAVSRRLLLLHPVSLASSAAVGFYSQ